MTFRRDHVRVEIPTPAGPDVLLWSVEETCRQLGGIHRRTLERYQRSGHLRPVKIGRRTFYRPADVRAIVAGEAA